MYKTPLPVFCQMLLNSHITPILQNLYWLQTAFRIKFKFLLFAFKAVSGLGPTYLTDMVAFYHHATGHATGGWIFWAFSAVEPCITSITELSLTHS